MVASTVCRQHNNSNWVNFTLTLIKMLQINPIHTHTFLWDCESKQNKTKMFYSTPYQPFWVPHHPAAETKQEHRTFHFKTRNTTHSSQFAFNTGKYHFHYYFPLPVTLKIKECQWNQQYKSVKPQGYNAEFHRLSAYICNK